MMDSDAAVPIIIKPNGRFGNLMFQYMWAEALAQRVGDRAQIIGPGIPQWGIGACPPEQQSLRPYVLDGQSVDLNEAAYFLTTGLSDGALIEGWGMRMEHFGQPGAWRSYFASESAGTSIAPDEILIHVRAEDIENGSHIGYYPMPFDWYDAILEETGKTPVFMGQLSEGAYSDALRARYSGARFLSLGDMLPDFQTIRHAPNKVLSISSFAWLAAWLGPPDAEIHYPVAGMFDPRMAHAMLLPYGDTRYRFWETEFPNPKQRAATTAAVWATDTRRVAPCGPVQTQRIAAFAATRRFPAAAVAAFRARMAKSPQTEF